MRLKLFLNFTVRANSTMLDHLKPKKCNHTEHLAQSFNLPVRVQGNIQPYLLTLDFPCNSLSQPKIMYTYNLKWYTLSCP